jgi:hypothetical protein
LNANINPIQKFYYPGITDCKNQSSIFVVLAPGYGVLSNCFILLSDFTRNITNIKMKKTTLILLSVMFFCSCSNAPLPKQVIEQEQYANTHTGYADATTLQYAISNGISPDSAVVLHNEHKF